MPSSSANTFQQQIQEVQKQYRQTALSRARAVSELVNELAEDINDFDQLREVFRLTHNIAGSAVTFDTPEFGRYAGEITELLRPYLENHSPLNLATLKELREKAKMLEEEAKSLQAAPESPSADESLPPIPKIDCSRPILIVEDDEYHAHYTSKIVEQLGLKTEIIHDTKDFSPACSRQEKPALIIMDMVFPEDELAGANLCAQVEQICGAQIPVIVVSQRDDIESRLVATRSGAARYLTKPIRREKLQGIIKGLLSQKDTQPYRILLIDDDQITLRKHQDILRATDMQIESISDPMEAWALTRSWMPDVIISKVDMPRCKGTELSVIMREEDDFAHIPILLLTLDRHNPHDYNNLRCDEFISLPVESDEFIATVTARAQRSRHLRRINFELHQALTERDFQQFALNQHAIVSIADVNGRIIYVNRKFCEVSGYNADELVGRNHKILKSGTHPTAFYEEMWKTISSGNVWQGEICNRKKNGGFYWVESTIVPFLDDEGLPLQYVSVRTEITNLIEMERVARENAQNLSTIFNTVPARIIYKDLDNNIIQANQAAADFFNTTTEDIVGTPYSRINTQSEDSYLGLDQDVARTGKPILNITEEITTHDGKISWHRVDRVPYKDTNGNIIGVIMYALDITQQMESQQALQKSEDRLRRSQAFANIGTWDWDIQSGALFWSERIGPLFGYQKEIPETTYENFVKAIHPEDRDDVAEAVRACVEDSKEYDIEHRVIWDDETVHWLHEKGDVIRDSEGNPLHMLGAVQDITAQKEYQKKLKIAQEESEKANRAKSKFLSSMSHELRTPLNAILGFGQILIADGQNPLNEEQSENVDEIIKAGNHLLELINDVLDLAKIESGTLALNIETINLYELVAEANALVQPLAQKVGIEMEIDLESFEDIYITADKTRTKQVLLNLISNAIKYNRPKGKVSIFVEVDKANVKVSVIDTGIGISTEDIQALFQPFNRLHAEKSDIEGTGIGLVITRRIVEGMNGTLSLESTEGKGSTFWFSLPKAETKKERGVNKRKQPKKPMSTQYLVLYIEDNPANIRLVTHLMQKRPKVEFVSAPNGYLGMELASVRHPNLILLDINLPGLNGHEILKKLRESDETKHIPVVALSANALSSDINKGLEEGFDEYLTKPLNIARFYRVIDEYTLGESDTDLQTQNS